MARDRIIYYRDELNDDFAGTDIHTTVVGEDFPFVRRSLVWRVTAFVIYRGVVTPIVWLTGRLVYGMRIRNRRALKGLKRRGFFLYGNHTQMFMDACGPSLSVFPHAAYVVAGPDAVSIKGIRWLVQMLGGIPLPSTLRGYKPFQAALHYRVKQGGAIVLYPEAHIWPYYTGIRPFPDTSFAYPIAENAPCVASVTTFRRRKLFKNAAPCLTVTLSEPFWPDPTLPPKEARKKMRDEVYEFMCRTANHPENYEYVKYIKKTEA